MFTSCLADVALTMHYILLNDPRSQVQHFVCSDHISGAEIRKEDQIVKLYLLGGQELTLTHEESKQFLNHVRSRMHVAEGG